MGLSRYLVPQRIVAWASQLRFPALLAVVGVLLVIDLLAVDPIPLVDELILALATVVLSRWKDRRTADGTQAPGSHPR